MTPDKRLEYTGVSDNRTRVEVMGGWQKTMVAEKLAGSMYWQYGFSGYSYGKNNDDGFTIYIEDAEAETLVYEHAKEMNALNKH